jgi:cobalt-zinc-cadmium efflux system membrane fusion protein
MKHLLYVIGLLILSGNSFADDTLVLNAKQIDALGISTASLPNKQQGEVSGLPGLVVIPSNQLFIISTALPAMIEQTLIGVGDTVKKGQVIARLQSPAMAEAQRGLLQAAAQNQVAQGNLTRDESLYKDGIISESRYRTSRGLAIESQAALAERRQMLHASGMSDNALALLQSGKNLNNLLTLTAPADGVVLEKSAAAGQRVDAAVPVFKIANLSSLALEIQAPLALTRDLKIGAEIMLPTQAASGKLTAIGRSLTGANQTILLRGIIVHGAENLRPGQYVEASIKTSVNNGAQWEIPNSAISRINGRNMLFVKTPSGFKALSISLLNEGAQNSLITGALKGDEIIATQGVSALKAGLTGVGGGE